MAVLTKDQLERLKEEFERKRKEAEEQHRLLLQQLEEQQRKAVEQGNQEFADKLIAVCKAEDGSTEFLKEYCAILTYEEGGNIEEGGFRCQFVPRKSAVVLKKTTTTSGGGMMTSRAKPVAIRPETAAQYGLTGKGEIKIASGEAWPSMRRLALALGVPKEDQHPDTWLLRKDTQWPAIRADLKDEAYQAAAFTASSTAPKAETESNSDAAATTTKDAEATPVAEASKEEKETSKK